MRLTHDDDSRIELVRDSLRMTRDLLHVRRNLKRGAYAFPAMPADVTPCPLCGASEFEARVAQGASTRVEASTAALSVARADQERAALEAYAATTNDTLRSLGAHQEEAYRVDENDEVVRGALILSGLLHLVTLAGLLVVHLHAGLGPWHALGLAAAAHARHVLIAVDASGRDVSVSRQRRGLRQCACACVCKCVLVCEKV